MEYPPSPVSPPWRFRLIVLTVSAMVIVLGQVVWAAAARARDRTARTQLVSDLQRLDELQMAWDARSGGYARRVAPLGDDSTLAFAPAAGVQLRFETGPGGGWSAMATSQRLTAAPRRCGIFRGPTEASPHRALTTPGEVRCW
jgi:hypothetical protein